MKLKPSRIKPKRAEASRTAEAKLNLRRVKRDAEVSEAGGENTRIERQADTKQVRAEAKTEAERAIPSKTTRSGNTKRAGDDVDVGAGADKVESPETKRTETNQTETTGSKVRPRRSEPNRSRGALNQDEPNQTEAEEGAEWRSRRVKPKQNKVK